VRGHHRLRRRTSPACPSQHHHCLHGERYDFVINADQPVGAQLVSVDDLVVTFSSEGNNGVDWDRLDGFSVRGDGEQRMALDGQLGWAVLDSASRPFTLHLPSIFVGFSPPLATTLGCAHNVLLRFFIL